jgi:glycosyltransferase 2 family protein
LNDRIRRLSMTAARFALSGALLWLLLSRTDASALMTRVAAIDPRWLAAAFALTVV